MIKKIPVLDVTWLIRYWLGIMMILHSYETLLFDGISGFAGYLEALGIPFPAVAGYLAKVSECLGGLMIILNIWTRLFSALIGMVMLVAVFVGHKGLIFGEAELAFNYFLLAVVLFFRPSIPFKLINK
ncbi:DoxX family protein [Flagellimonas meishanensis]|uniref:DoxX family protein n=1 Tax=Flagellimonas meishanensis TaxID=2873264 RepID=UPI001CA7648B|nr:DoxX family protein [[Muricauda] meishanensis]